MSIYEGQPNPNQRFFEFVRVKDTIAITNPGDVKVNHKTLAKNNGLLEEVERLIKENPDEADGGSGIFARLSEKFTITLKDRSHTLDIPTSNEARQRTIELFRKKTPGWEVRSVGRILKK
jgi:hypothetical protein